MTDRIDTEQEREWLDTTLGYERTYGGEYVARITRLLDALDAMQARAERAEWHSRTCENLIVRHMNERDGQEMRAEKAETERDQALARLAAAYEAAATVQANGFDMVNPAARDTIRALTPADAEAALQRVVDAAVPETLTDAQINDACMSYRHDFGLLEGDEREIVKFQCREWWRSIRRALKRPEASHE